MMCALQNDPFQTAALMMYGEWCQQETDAICSVLPRSGFGIDVGANIGTVAVAMARKVGKDGLIYAFEPQYGPFCCLSANAALTHCLMQLRCVRAAVGSSNGAIGVPMVDLNQPFNMGGVRLNDPDYDEHFKLPKEEVSLVTLDSFQFPRCDVIKIDVEAMEGAVLFGAMDLVERCRPVIFAETINCFGNETERRNLNEMLEFFRLQNYDPRNFGMKHFNEQNARFCPDNILPGEDFGVVAWPVEKEKSDWFSKLTPVQLKSGNDESALLPG